MSGIVPARVGRKEAHIPVDKIGVKTVTGSITVGPNKLTLGGLSRSPVAWPERILEHDTWNTDRVIPWTLTLTVTGAKRVDDMRVVTFIEVDTVPTTWEEDFSSNTIGAVPVKIEVVLLDRSRDEIGIDMACDGDSFDGRRFGVWVTDEHPQTLGER
jgi:hypothetical protein